MDDQGELYFEERGYRGNQNIRPKGHKQEWTPEQIMEFIKCSNDPIYFIKTYVKIVHVDHGIIPFAMWDFQEEFVKQIHENRLNIARWARQQGKSQSVAAYMLHFVLFNANKFCAILANKADSAREIIGRIQLSYELLPFWMKMGVVDWNKGSFTLENGSKIIAAATSSSAIRGRSVSFLLLDEFSFIPKNMAEDFFRSVYPTISSGKTTKLVIISTPFGMNHYYKLWNEAVQGTNGYIPHFADWRRVPGRDEEWREETIRNIGQQAFSQEYDVDFLGSAGTLISGDILKSLTYIKPYYEDIDGLKIYVAPKPKRVYMLSVDTSEGLGLDSHSINIIDITEYPYNQVCTFRNSTLDPMLLPDVVFSLGTKYNNAYVIIELNSMGNDVAKVLKDELEYENMLYVIQSGRKGQVLTGGNSSKIQNGLKMTKQSKRVGCQSLKTLIENQKLIINDFDTYSELTTFVRAKDSYEAEAGANDDTVMSLVVFAWVVNQKYFKEEMEQDIRKNINRQTVLNLEENLLPFGVFDDGIEETQVRQRVDYDTEFVSSSFFD